MASALTHDCFRCPDPGPRGVHAAHLQNTSSRTRASRRRFSETSLDQHDGAVPLQSDVQGVRDGGSRSRSIGSADTLPPRLPTARSARPSRNVPGRRVRQIYRFQCFRFRPGRNSLNTRVEPVKGCFPVRVEQMRLRTSFSSERRSWSIPACHSGPVSGSLDRPLRILSRKSRKTRPLESKRDTTNSGSAPRRAPCKCRGEPLSNLRTRLTTSCCLFTRRIRARDRGPGRS